jgi:hypothetical protein
VRVRARVCVRGCVCAIVCGVCMCVCVFDECVRRGAMRALSWHGGDLVFIARRATRVPRVCLSIHAAGAMWRCRTASAPWAGRDGHTSVIDAAGAIYVIGGLSERDGSNGTTIYTYYHDVWVSTDGGGHRTRVGGSRGYWVSTQG